MLVQIEKLSKKDFLKIKDGSKKTYYLLGYCRTNKAYEIGNWDDISESRYIKKGKKVFIGFEF